MVKSTSCNHVAYNLNSPFLDAVISEASCVTCIVVEAKVRTQFAIEAKDRMRFAIRDWGQFAVTRCDSRFAIGAGQKTPSIPRDQTLQAVQNTVIHQAPLNRAAAHLQKPGHLAERPGERRGAQAFRTTRRRNRCCAQGLASKSC